MQLIEQQKHASNTHLGLDIELRKLLLIPHLTVIIARVHPHLHLRIQFRIDLAGGIEALRRKNGGTPPAGFAGMPPRYGGDSCAPRRPDAGIGIRRGGRQVGQRRGRRGPADAYAVVPLGHHGPAAVAGDAGDA